MDEDEPVVIDNGSWLLKFGFGGDDKITAPVPCFSAGKLRYQDDFILENKIYFGDESKLDKKRNLISFKSPIERGIITDMEMMENLWCVGFRQLRLKQAEINRPILISDHVLDPIYNRENIVEIFFERFCATKIFISHGTSLSLLYCGRTTGLSIDIGHSLITTSILYEGYLLSQASFRSELGGIDLSNYLQDSLSTKGHYFNDNFFLVENEIKPLCYVAEDYEQEMKKGISKKYQLFGEEISLENELFEAPEILFQPSLIGSKALGITELICKSIEQIGSDLVKDILQNITLVGGCSMFRGLSDRIFKDLSKKFPNCKIKVVAAPERNKSIWMGGSVVAAITQFRHFFFSKEEYKEFGPNLVHRRCHL